MWHIMEKVSVKVGARKINSYRFRSRLASLVWTDSLTEQQFEDGWAKFIQDYELINHNWFSDMYKLRSYWVPAYFRDVLMGGLIRTTSISESQNSFFGKYTSSKFTLVELLFHFDTAMDNQRHEQMLNDVDCDIKIPDLKTPLKIEKHSVEEYTLKIFFLVQKEIYNSCFFCCVRSEKQGNLIYLFYIVHIIVFFVHKNTLVMHKSFHFCTYYIFLFINSFQMELLSNSS